MVYIDRYGRVLEKRPWDINRVVEIFIGLWFLIVHFFKSLLAPFTTERRGGSRNNGSGYSPGGGGGGGGGSRGGRYGGNDGLRPNRRIGRITNSMDCNIPGGG